MANCPECEALLDVDDDEVEEGDVISCAECGLELEVVTVNPIEVERVEEEEEEEQDEEGRIVEDDEDDYGDEGEEER
jgi:alpha-aminoadipate carrier protein LysW